MNMERHFDCSDAAISYFMHFYKYTKLCLFNKYNLPDFNEKLI